MPLTERDPNVSGRESRASNISGKDVRSASTTGMSPADVLSSGVLGMLKTTTESGDIGALSFQTRRLPKVSSGTVPRQSHNKVSSRPSSHFSRSASVRSKASNRSNRSANDPPMPGSWPYSHFPNFETLDVEHSNTDSRAYMPQESTRSLPLSSERPEPSERSFSITQNLHPAHGINYHQSLTSLRSQGPPARPRSPYAYPTRLRRPGYRPGSPASSDNAGAMYKRPYMMRPGPAPRAHSTSPLPPGGYRELAYRHGANRSTPLLRTPSPLDIPQMPDHDIPNHAYHNQQPQMSRFNKTLLPLPAPELSAHPHYRQAAGQMQPVGAHMYRNVDEYHFLPPVQARPPLPNTAPYMGFVQRVKTVLEERISSEDTGQRQPPNGQVYYEEDHAYTLEEHLQPTEEPAYPIADQPIAQPPSPSTSPLMTSIAMGMIEAPETPLVEIISTTAPSTPTIKRLTRDMIKEATDTTSEAGVMSPASYEASIMQYDSGNSSNESPTKKPSEPQRIIEAEHEFPVNQSEDDHDAELQEDEPLGETTTTSVLEFPAHIEDFSARFSIPEEPVSDVSNIIEVNPNESDSASLNSSDSFSAAPPAPHANAFGERPASLPHTRGPYADWLSQRGHAPTRSIPTIGDFSRYLSLNAQVQPKDKADEDVPKHEQMVVGSEEQSPENKEVISSTKEAELEPEEVSEFSNNPGMVTVFPEPETNDENQPIVTTTVHPSSYSDSGHWATPSIIARRSYIPIDPRSGHTSVSSIDGRLDPRRSSDLGASPAITPALSIRRSSKRISVSSEQDTSLTATQGSNSSVVESRLSGLRQFQFPLPDLTEDSQEDASTTNLRILGARPPGFRSSGPRGIRYDGRPSNRVSMQPQQPQSYLSRSGTNSCEMPSLNFSHSDLTARLNQALGLRSSKSLEEVKRSKRRGIVISLERSASSGSFKERERYRSFFMSSDEPEHEDETTVELTDRLISNTNLLSEINRLSIPSVNNLTIRLSELLPSINAGLGESDLTKDDDAVKHTIDEIRDLGSPERLASAAASTAGPMSAGRPSLAEAMLEGSRSGALYLMKDLPPLPRDRSNKRLSLISTPSTLPVAAAFESRKDSTQRDVAELEAPMQKPSTQVAQHSTPVKSVTEKKSMHSVKDKTGDGQPWNQEGNYPWSENTQTMDITVPSQITTTESPATQPLIKSKTSRSTLDAHTDKGVHIARTMSPGLHADADLIPKSDGPDLEKSTPLKKGLIGSLSRKIGIRPRIDKAGFAMDPAFLHPEERPVDPGDRYPTTGLTPPAGLNIEENRSFFSDDSSRTERIVSLRKRLVRRTRKPTSMRPTSAMRPFSPSTSRSDTHRATTHWVTNGGSVFGTDSNLANEPTQPEVVILYEQTPAGMSKVEFRAKRIIEKLRFLWLKSGNMFRGKNRRHPPGWYETTDIFPAA